MRQKIILTEAVDKVTGSKQNKKVVPSDQTVNKQDKKKKKQNSALVAASKVGSAVTKADAHAYKDGDFANTGSNLTYRENQ